MTDRTQQLPGAGLGRKLVEHGIDRAEPDDEVVAVVAVAEDRVQPGEVRGVTLHDSTTAAECAANRAGVNDDRR
jgi:hypothetical protein